jgi:hypothetical protein
LESQYLVLIYTIGAVFKELKIQKIKAT